MVLLGLYPVFIGAIVNFQLDILVVFALGGVIGLMAFSRLLSWLLDNYQSCGYRHYVRVFSGQPKYYLALEAGDRVCTQSFRQDYCAGIRQSTAQQFAQIVVRIRKPFSV